MDYAITKYIHLIGILILFASLVLEHTLLKREMGTEEINRLALVDRIYGISAAVVLTAGLLLWFAVGKPAQFYTSNPVFHAKLTLFVVIGLMSIYPTRFYLRNRRSSGPAVTVPRSVIMVVRTELVLLLVMPLLAVLMAQGYGLR